MSDESVPSSRFFAAYQGTPPWDIGAPQPAFVALAEGGAIRGAVLDAGCGPGANALLCAARGPEGGGPRRVTEAEIRAAFSAERGFRIRDIAAATFMTTFHAHGGQAWLASVERLAV